MRSSARTSKSRGVKHGYRSGLENRTAKQLKDAGKPVKYEQEKIAFTWPARPTTYRPDFKIVTASGGFFYVETKGRFTVQDRQKHLLIREQHPELDIRFVFSNHNAKLYKGSPTTYAMWCEKHGFVYANKTIPDAWLSE